ncbi:hypothetical protein GCM10007422_11690 [Pedobacter zeae]|nr:hypothetical protein GCM10007422_11690 [Pedobacter zeae]
MDATGQVGDFIGGVVGTIFSLSGFMLLLVTLNAQSKSDHIQKFENIFFEMVKFHRDNIQELEFDVHENSIDSTTAKTEEKKYQKRKVFMAVFTQFIQCRNEVESFFRNSQGSRIYKTEYFNQINAIKKYRKGTFDLKYLAILDISWCVTFYGLSNESELILRSLFKKKYDDDMINFVLSYLKLKPKRQHPMFPKWEEISRTKKFSKKIAMVEHAYHNKGKLRKGFSIPPIWGYRGDTDNIASTPQYSFNFQKYYGGHQFRLGHYYRHLYQTVKFVDRQKKLKQAVKYDYVKILRAQISIYEQALLVVNSLSSLGHVWEFIPDYKSHFGLGLTIEKNVS